MKKIILGLVALLAMTSAHAIQLKFEFDVNSSGSSIYPCNAGLKHVANTERICYDRETKNACNPSVECPVQGPNDSHLANNCNCVCSGVDGGANNVDFVSATYSKWTDHNKHMSKRTKPAKIKASTQGRTNYNTLFETDVTNAEAVSNVNYFKKQLRTLSFNLGSEKFGAEYFLDVCFRGPQIDYYKAGIKTNWLAKAKATIQNVTGGKQVYADLSDLIVSSEIECTYQDSNNNFRNKVISAEDFSDEATWKTLFHSTPLRSGSEQANGQTNIHSNKIGAPTFCKVRYNFKESVNTGDYSEFRPWKLQQAKVCTETSIEEP